MPRLYEPLWAEIKSKPRNTVVRIEVRKVFAARVKKAVIKEKYMDEGFKLLNDSDKWRLVIEYDEVRELMQFCLKPSIGIEDLVVESSTASPIEKELEDVNK